MTPPDTTYHDHTCPLPGYTDPDEPVHANLAKGDLVLGCFPGWPWHDGRIYRIHNCTDTPEGRRYDLVDPDNGATLIHKAGAKNITAVTLSWRPFAEVPPWPADYEIAELRGLRAHVGLNRDGKTWHYVVAPMTAVHPVVHGAFPDAETAKEHAARELFAEEKANARRAVAALI
ncbi:hypothetical protein ABZ801_00855 [Actinomadura sp. NPDC047616]|uniref:hypothetical protein n=1 Tax=Actinomadura sp. NPDC047616 TaxID=3155914 RepID=UPI0033F525DC